MPHRTSFVVVLAVAWLGALAVAAHAEVTPVQPGVSPLTDAQAKVFWGSAEDPPPKKLGGVTKAQEGRSYVAGNEWNLHLYRETLKNRGGGYVGVGSDQAYLFIGWQRPALAWLMDYDPTVKKVHRAYHAFFMTAKTPAEFLELWGRGVKDRALGAIDTYYKDDRKARMEGRAAWLKYRGFIYKRLKAVKDKLDGMTSKVPTFLNDQDTYDFIVKLIAAKRVRPLVGDLLFYKGMKGISASAKKLGVPVRVVYVSNAEQYWDYTKRYKKNLQGMHVDDKSVFLRTLLTWKRNKDYRYTVQSWKNLVTWLERPWVRRVTNIVPMRKDKGKNVEFLVIDRDVNAVEEKLRKKGFKL